MFAVRKARSLLTRPHPGPLRQAIRSPVSRALRSETTATSSCDPVEECSYEVNMEDQLWHMADLNPPWTGLPMWIWFSPAYPPLDQPRLQVSKEYDEGSAYKVTMANALIGPRYELNWFTVTVEKEPQVVEQDTGRIKEADIELVKQYIKLNLDAILRFWNDDDSDELFNTLKPLHNSMTATRIAQRLDQLRAKGFDVTKFDKRVAQCLSR